MVLTAVLATAASCQTGSALQTSAPGYRPDDAAVPPSPHAAVRWKAFLLAGDHSIRAFDNAIKDLTVMLERRGVAVAHRFSATQSELSATTTLATVANLQRVAATSRVGPGEGCLVYATSHGSVHGLLLASDPASNRLLTPAALRSVLAAACGEAPTVVVMSGCHTGTFLRSELIGPRAVMLTAAVAHRQSFGCRSDRRYTFYDGCVLRELPRAATWQRLYQQVAACIQGQEQALHELPSEPQAFFGREMKDLPIPKERPA